MGVSLKCLLEKFLFFQEASRRKSGKFRVLRFETVANPFLAGATCSSMWFAMCRNHIYKYFALQEKVMELPDPYLPGAISLLDQLDKKLLVVLRDGRTLIGYLR